MSLSALHTLTGFLIIIGLIIKLGLHLYLDQLHQRSTGLLAIWTMPLVFCKPYRAEINPAHQLIKMLCNAAWWLTLVSLLVNLIVGILLL